jgi:hypothetical protein
MPLSKNIHSYSDVASVLATALPSGSATYRLASDGAAVHWMQRANKYRLLLQAEEKAKTSVKGYQPPTPYDRMKLVRKGAAVEIDFNPTPAGELSLPGGKVVKPTPIEDRPPPPAPVPVFSPRTAEISLEDAAAQLAAQFDDE